MGTERLAAAPPRTVATTDDPRFPLSSALRRPEVPLRLAVCELPAESLVAAAGELDLASAPQLVQTLRPLDRPGAVVTLDLGALTFMDVAGLRALVEARREASRSGAVLRILRPGEAASRVLELTGSLDLVE
jgi:anti-anti-sigma factor